MKHKLNIVTPSKRLVSDVELEQVFVPAHRGELNILPGHSPLVSTLTEGVLRYQTSDSDEMKSVAISWGYIEITPTTVNILAETAESKAEIDLPRAQETLKKVEAGLASATIDPDAIEKLHRKRRRAEARIAVAQS